MSIQNSVFITEDPDNRIWNQNHWHGPLTIRSSGRPLKVLKQSANNCFSGDVISGRQGPLQSARRKFLLFAVSKPNNELFCCCSLHFSVMPTFRFTCFQANQWTMLWINQSNRHFNL